LSGVAFELLEVGYLVPGLGHETEAGDGEGLGISGQSRGDGDEGDEQAQQHVESEVSLSDRNPDQGGRRAASARR